MWDTSPQPDKSSQSPGRHLGAGDGPTQVHRNSPGTTKHHSLSGNKPQPPGHVTGQSGDHKASSQPGEYPQCPAPGAIHSSQVFATPEGRGHAEVEQSGGSPRFVTPVLSQTVSGTRGNAPLTILQRGSNTSQNQVPRRELQQQQQHMAKPMPGSYPNPSPGAYQPSQQRLQ